MIKSSMKLILAGAFLLLFSQMGLAFPLTGVYYQTGNVAELELYDGIVHVGYWSNTPANIAGTTWDAALRAPFVLAKDDRLTIKGFLGYHLQTSSTSTAGATGANDLVSGLQYGGLVSYHFTPDISFLADYFMTSLLGGSTTLGAIAVNSVTLTRYEAGLVFKLPQNADLMLGYASWSLPRELGSGAAALSGNLVNLSGFVVGLNFQILP